MKDLKKLEEIASSANQVLLPNRYQEPFIEAYQAITGEEVPRVAGRKLSSRSNGKVFRWMRGRDIPSVVWRVGWDNPKSATVGFTGSEWCEEYDCQDYRKINWNIVSERKLGSIALIALASSNLDSIRAKLDNKYCRVISDKVRVVTALPELIDSEYGNLDVEMPVQGCVESVAETLGLAAVDLVSSGETLRANGFVVVKELQDSYPAMVTYNTRRN